MPPPPVYSQHVTVSGADDRHVVRVVRGGAVHTWGADNTRGQQGRPAAAGSHRPRAVRALQPDIVVEVAAGGAHSLFLTMCGEVLGCGSNAWGQLGGLGGPLVDTGSGRLTVLPHLHPARRVAAGCRHSVLLCRVHLNRVHFFCSPTPARRLDRSAPRTLTAARPVAAAVTSQVSHGTVVIMDGGALAWVPDPACPAWEPPPAAIPSDTRVAAAALTRGAGGVGDVWFWISARDGRVYAWAAPLRAPVAAPVLVPAVALRAAPGGVARFRTENGQEHRWQPRVPRH